MIDTRPASVCTGSLVAVRTCVGPMAMVCSRTRPQSPMRAPPSHHGHGTSARRSTLALRRAALLHLHRATLRDDIPFFYNQNTQWVPLSVRIYRLAAGYGHEALWRCRSELHLRRVSAEHRQVMKMVQEASSATACDAAAMAEHRQGPLRPWVGRRSGRQATIGMDGADERSGRLSEKKHK